MTISSPSLSPFLPRVEQGSREACMHKEEEEEEEEEKEETVQSSEKKGEKGEILRSSQDACN